MPARRFANNQGYELGWPSRILIEAARNGSTISGVRVGGCVVKLIGGTVYV